MLNSLKIDLPFPEALQVLDNDFDELDENYYLDADLRDAEIASFHNASGALSISVDDSY